MLSITLSISPGNFLMNDSFDVVTQRRSFFMRVAVAARICQLDLTRVDRGEEVFADPTA